MLPRRSSPAVNFSVRSRMPPLQPAQSAYGLREHYLVECELAQRLRDAPKEDRRQLYSALYDELFRRVPDHPQLTNKISPELSRARTKLQMDFLKRFVTPDISFLEVGPGDCALSFQMARQARFVYGVDVSNEVTKCDRPPANFALSLSDGTSIPVAQGTIDLAYSNQLMEHLHPDDAMEQLQNIHAALAPNGRYVCITPSRLTGPHDVSRYYDHEPRGFHLKEYSTYEMAKLFKRVGFRKLRAAIGGKGAFWLVPVWVVAPFERALELLPLGLRRTIARRCNFLLGVRLIATK
jgi:SAM-dependent methyltransferase